MALPSSSMFGRVVEVQVGLPGQHGRVFGDGLRIVFDVTAGVGRKPNEAKIQIFGLTRDSAAWCAQDGAMVQLLAGYQTPGMIFRGDIDQARTPGTRPERVTAIEARDGGRVFSDLRVSKSYSGTVAAQRVLADLADLAGLALAPIGDLGGKTMPGGTVLHGQWRDCLAQVAATVGLQESVQDGQVVLLSIDGSTGEQAPDIGPDSGLVGSPTPLYDGPRKIKGVELVCLLTPTLKPGRRFNLRSADFTGIYRCEQASHSGDSWAGDFYTKVQAKAVA